MRRDRLLRQMLRERFIVTLKNGQGTFDGLIDDHDESTIELLDVHALQPDGPPVAVQGRMYLPRADIAHMQRPDAP